VRKYNKPPLPVAGQLEKLKSRGLQIEDDAEALHYLLHIGYYRSTYRILPAVRLHADVSGTQPTG
jgi:abortive infection bacteriophage resistance protein